AAEEADESAVVVGVRTAKAERRSISAEGSAVGTIFPRGQAVGSARINRQIKKMRLLTNVAGKGGAHQAVLHARRIKAQRRAAAAALQETRLNLKGVQTSSIPQAEAQIEKDLHDAHANVNNARALYERRRALYQKGGIALKDVQDSQLALTTAEDSLK